MKKIWFAAGLVLVSFGSYAQNILTAEQLWKLGRVSGMGVSKDKKNVIYAVSTPSVEENKSTRKLYSIPVTGNIKTPGVARGSDNNPFRVFLLTAHVFH